MWSSIGVFVLGIVFLGTQSAHIPIICKSLDNCAVDEKFSSQYQQAKDMAVTAQKLSESAKNVEELRASQQQLQDAIAQLKTIPTSAKVYDTAQKELADYQSQLTKIQSRLNKENQAIDSINEAKQQAQDAEEQIEKAQTVSEYEAVKEKLQQAKDKLQQAIATLNDIPSNTFISERVTNLKETYQLKQEKVVAKIEDLNKPTPSPEPTPTSTPTPEPTPSPTNYPTSTPTIEAANKSRREYVCKFLGFNQGVRLEPSISGSFIRGGYCYIPVEGRECISVYDNKYQPIVDGTEWSKNCEGLVPIVNDPNTGESYYRLNPFNGRFIFSK
jgi:tetratricopeptide (TPR) repeat protein